MPQLTLEYTQNIDPAVPDIGDVLSELHRALTDLASIDIENFKSRAHCLADYRIGDGTCSEAFVHLEVALFGGRPLELRQKLGNRCLEILQKHFADAMSAHPLQITVEIREVDREAYMKASSV